MESPEEHRERAQHDGEVHFAGSGNGETGAVSDLGETLVEDDDERFGGVEFAIPGAGGIDDIAGGDVGIGIALMVGIADVVGPEDFGEIAIWGNADDGADEELRAGQQEVDEEAKALPPPACPKFAHRIAV